MQVSVDLLLGDFVATFKVWLTPFFCSAIAELKALHSGVVLRRER
jgi:hypothetical protein